MGILFIIKNKISQNFTKFFFCNHLERAKRMELLERALALLERRLAATRARVCGDNAMNVRWACGDFELRCKITAFLWHGNGLSLDLWGSCPLTCETAWGKTAEDDHFRKNSEKHLQKNAPLCAILRRRKKAHSKICSTHFFVVILQRHSFRRVMVFRYLYHEETPKNI